MNIILQKVRETVQKENKDYDILIKQLYLYYDMKLVPFGIDDKRNLIVQFPLFVHPQNQQHLILYQLETVPVPIIDRNENAQSYTHLQVTKPYIALNSETYISLRIQELEACKKIGYEFYCEELFVVKHRSQHNCESAIYFDSNAEIINVKTYLTMSDKFFIPDLMHYLRSYIKGCHICQLSNKDKIPNRHF